MGAKGVAEAGLVLPRGVGLTAWGASGLELGGVGFRVMGLGVWGLGV